MTCGKCRTEWTEQGGTAVFVPATPIDEQWADFNGCDDCARLLKWHREREAKKPKGAP